MKLSGGYVYKFDIIFRDHIIGLVIWGYFDYVNECLSKILRHKIRNCHIL